MLNSTTTYATILPNRYDSYAREDAVSHGLAIVPLGMIQNYPSRILVQIDGVSDDARAWILRNGAHYVEPLPDPVADIDAENSITLARGLLLRALYETTGAESLALADEARELVGIEGIRTLARRMGEDDGGYLRGALGALVGERSDWIRSGSERRGYEYVAEGGYVGIWSGIRIGSNGETI